MKHWHSMIAALALSVFGSQAWAAHKCLGADGVMRYQELPCARGQAAGVVMTPDQQRYQQRIDELEARLKEAEKQVEERRRLAAQGQLGAAPEPKSGTANGEQNKTNDDDELARRYPNAYADQTPRRGNAALPNINVKFPAITSKDGSDTAAKKDDRASKTKSTGTYRPGSSPGYTPPSRGGNSSTVHTGPRGGRYVITPSGKKRYLKK